jgi:hypothetical protein
MDAKKRRDGGAHYTSEENVQKLIRPLFLDELRRELKAAKADPASLKAFVGQLGRLKFLDPACGGGDFLILAYRELKLLELEAIKTLYLGHKKIPNSIFKSLKVNITSFYGIEIDELASLITKISLFITECRLNARFAKELGISRAHFPPSQPANVINGNALRTDWANLVPKAELSYVLGNPPFNGARTMTKAQKEDIFWVFGGLKGANDLDYVAAWLKKAADLAYGTTIRCAFVATSSVFQGAQPAIVWKPLTEMGVQINFGVKNFKWGDLDGRWAAGVFCAIVGFSFVKTKSCLNQYLLEAPTVFVERRSRPLDAVPKMGIGNMPVDGGHYLFTQAEKEEFLKHEPIAEKWFRPWAGAEELIFGKSRFCLFLRDCPPGELAKMPETQKRVEAVRLARLASKRPSTKRRAVTPTRFMGENLPKSSYIAIPKVTSPKRRYIPIDFLTPDVLSSDLLFILPNSTLYHFGVLTSIVHMAWVRAVCGRFGEAFRYSIEIVYNNFPGPVADAAEQSRVVELAEEVLRARRSRPNATLAALYDDALMPPDLLNAHRDLDLATMKLYGFRTEDIVESEIVAKLFRLFQEKTLPA